MLIIRNLIYCFFSFKFVKRLYGVYVLKIPRYIKKKTKKKLDTSSEEKLWQLHEKFKDTCH